MARFQLLCLIVLAAIETELSFESTAACIKAISLQELKTITTVVIDTHYVENETKSKIFATEVMERLMESKVSVVYTNKRYRELAGNNSVTEDSFYVNINKYNIVVINYFETCSDMSSIFKVIDMNTKYIFIVIDPLDNKCTAELEKIKNVALYDVTFMSPDKAHKARNNIVSFIPVVDRHACSNSTNGGIIKTVCINGILQAKHEFPTNSINLNKCPLRIGMANRDPMCRIKNYDLLKKNDPIDEATGSDVELMKIIAKHINAKLDLRDLHLTHAFLDHSFRDYLINGSLDACSGGMLSIYGDSVEYSNVYSFEAHKWVYYAEREDRSWKNLIKKFNNIHYFSIFYISYVLIWYLIRKFDGDEVSLKNTLLNSWGTSVGANSLQDPRSKKQKTLNVMYLIMSIYLSSYVSIHLYSFLTIREHPHLLNTNEDVMGSGRVSYATLAHIRFVEDKKYQDFLYKSQDCSSSEDCAIKAFTNKGLTILAQNYFYNFQYNTIVDGEAKMLRANDNVFTFYNVVVVRKDSPLLFKIREIIQRLFEAGITYKLQDEAIGKLIVAKSNVAASNMMANSYSCEAGCAITFKQIAGVFYIWIFGCILSCLVFAFECIANCKVEIVV